MPGWKDKKKLWRKEYYERNKIQIKQYNQNYYQKQRDNILAQKRVYDAQNREKKRIYKSKNREKFSLQAKHRYHDKFNPLIAGFGPTGLNVYEC